MLDKVLVAEEIGLQRSVNFRIKDFNFELKKGEIVSVIGANGCGKSTVLRLMSNLVSPEHGQVYLDGEDMKNLDPKSIAQRLTMLPQVNDQYLDLTIYDLVKYGRTPYLKWYEKINENEKDIVHWALSVTNLEHMKYRSLNTLSGGERQRAWIAMSLAQTPDILLLDEPTTYLDISHQIEVLELVKQLNEERNITIVMVLHDLNQAAKYSHRLIAMNSGRVVRHGTPVELFNKKFFREVFSINVNIYYDDGVPFFIPSSTTKDTKYEQKNECS